MQCDKNAIPIRGNSTDTNLPYGVPYPAQIDPLLYCIMLASPVRVVREGVVPRISHITK